MQIDSDGGAMVFLNKRLFCTQAWAAGLPVPKSAGAGPARSGS
jgi:hypothetical protein